MTKAKMTRERHTLEIKHVNIRISTDAQLRINPTPIRTASTYCPLALTPIRIHADKNTSEGAQPNGHERSVVQQLWPLQAVMHRSQL